MKRPSLHLNDVINFGLYRGKTVAEIMKQDISYLCWLRDNTKIKFSKEVKQKLNKHETTDKDIQ